MKTWKNIIAAMAVLAVGAFGSLSSGLAAAGENIEQRIAEAKTPADHEAIAAYYEKEAQVARQKQAQHQKMAEAYAKIPHLRQKSSAVEHCQAIAKKYEGVAQDAEELTQLHREMAKPAE